MGSIKNTLYRIRPGMVKQANVMLFSFGRFLICGPDWYAIMIPPAEFLIKKAVCTDVRTAVTIILRYILL